MVVTGSANGSGETAEAERAAQVQALFDLSPNMLSVVGPDGRFLLVNPAYIAVLGYTADELRERTFADVTHPDDREAARTLAEKLFSGEISNYVHQKRYITKGGATLWADLTATAVLDGNGRVRYGLGIVNDSSERRAAEKALADREKQLADREQQLADAEALTHAGSFTSDAGAKTIRWSDELYRIFGTDPLSVTPSLELLFGLAHPDDLERLQACIDEQMRTGAPFDLDYRIIRFDGTQGWVRVQASVIMGPAGPEQLIGSVQDITESKRLQESLAGFGAIIESSDIAIVSLSPDCIIRTWNPAAEKLYGYSSAEAVGQSVAILLSRGAGNGSRRSVLERVALGDRIENHETQIVRKDGTVLAISLNASPIRDDHGTVVGISSIAHDITELRKGRDALRNAHDDLARSVGELEIRNSEVTQLNEMGDLLQSCSDLDEVSKVIRKFARRLFPGQSGAVSVIAASRNLLETVASWGDVHDAGFFGPQDCWALRRGRVHRVDDVDDEVICPHVGTTPPGAYVCVPMMAQGETLGLLHLHAGAGADPDEDGSGDKRQRLAAPVAEHLSLALANFSLRETLRNQSIRDPLTGLYNRRYMEESLRRELARAHRNKKPVAILAIDVDHFKAFNDTHGHPAGDALLSGLGALLKKSIRSEDIACRYGGEEFNLILPDCGLAEGIQRANQIRESVIALRVGVRNQSYGGITISVGVAAFPEDGTEPDTLLQRADEALYGAKDGGRDRVVASTR